ncbi:uncharacterized protein LOC123307477 [Coccinella septempunctata]|uniref:uncharacterized protein LOC123307477 n=1 Tax=Coccinella septempunctata TaxID=41139 RepID=UPI001D06EACC|nr:uncharacterized protein LOC123307477 [Coccinella septempunctata]
MNKTKKYADKAATILRKQCKKKTNKLVYTDYPKVPRGHCQPVYVPKIYKPCGTRIRYCTAKELKLMAGRRMCECPRRGKAFETGRFIVNTLRNAIKAAAILGVSYVTYDMGFWGIPKDTQNTFAGLCEAMPCRIDPCKSYDFKPRNRECEETLELLKVSPHDPCSCDNPIPVDMEKCCYKMKQVWNHTVIFVFEGIANAPDNVINFVARKWQEFMTKECDPCRRMGMDEDEFPLPECKLEDDYDEKYSKEMEDECEAVQKELKAYLEEEEGGESNLPPCGY